MPYVKERDVQRSVRIQRFNRSAGDAPSLGKVTRVHSPGLPKEAMRRRRRDASSRSKGAAPSGKHRRNVILTWTVVLVVAVLGVLAFFFWSWVRPRMGRQPLTVEEQAALNVQSRNISAFDSPSEQAALDLVKQALDLRDPGLVEKYFRPGAAGPEVVISFLTEMKDRDGDVTGCQWLSSMDANGMLIDGVLVSTSKNDVPRNRLALLTPDAAGVWKIDFDAFARAVKPSWDKLMAAGPVQGLVRVIIAKDSYYNGPFKDEAQWVSYGMASPDHETILLGYCRKDSPQARAMEQIVSSIERKAGEEGDPRRKLNRATLELRRPESAENRQFEITRVIAEDWVVGAKPFDEAFK
jgi:hypothetical protein